MASNVYQPIVLSVSVRNPQAGDRITVTLSKRNGKDVAWSTGPDFSRISGISLVSAPGNSIPVSGFSITNSAVTIILAASSSGQPAMFNAQFFLVAVPDIEEFVLAATTDQGCAVAVTLQGRLPIELNESPAIFDWTA